MDHRHGARRGHRGLDPGRRRAGRGSLPLAVVFALVACLLCAWCIGLLAREMPSAGSMATYAARGLHPAVGFLVAWGYVLVGWLIPPLVLLQLGFTTASTINSEFHGYPANLWWPWSLAGAVIVLAAGYFGVRTSARLGTILGVFEIAVFLVLAVFLVVHAGSHNTGQVFTTHYSPTGLTGVIGGSVFTLLAFGGFEGAAPLAEEARDPRRTIRRAVLLATLLIGLLYVFTTYAVDVAYGPKGFAAFATFTGNASWEGLARSLYGLFWFFVFLAIVNSTIANANAGVNVSSRTAYAMGRIGAFPRFLAIVSPRHRSPVNSVLVAFVITVAVTLGSAWGTPDRGVRDGGHRAGDRDRGDLHRDVRRVHRVLRPPRRGRVQLAVAPDHPGARHRRVRPGLADLGGHQGVLLRHPAGPAAVLHGPRGGRVHGRRRDLHDLPVPDEPRPGHRRRPRPPGRPRGRAA